MAKKVSKFFRIGVEGDTCDGREIDVNDIKQMAQHYSPKVRGARINLEHIKSVLPPRLPPRSRMSTATR